MMSSMANESGNGQDGNIKYVEISATLCSGNLPGEGVGALMRAFEGNEQQFYSHSHGRDGSVILLCDPALNEVPQIKGYECSIWHR